MWNNRRSLVSVRLVVPVGMGMHEVAVPVLVRVIVTRWIESTVGVRVLAIRGIGVLSKPLT